jgi:predicted transcriptional regulator
MSRDIRVRTSAAALAQLERVLSKQRDLLIEDAEALDTVYQRATWNDSVSEKARVSVNEYIDQLNHGLAELNGVIMAVAQMRSLAEQYESME